MSRDSNLYNKVQSKWNELKTVSPDIRYFLSAIDKRPGIKVGVFGGAVRDWYLGKTPKDIDIVVEAPDQMLEDLLGSFGAQKNGFHGNVITINGVMFDLWALKDTYAFRSGQFSASWSNLAISVPFNTDSVIVMLDGTVVTHSFWDAMNDRKIRFLNRTVRDKKKIAARAVMQAEKYDFEISSELKKFCSEHLHEEYVFTGSSNAPGKHIKNKSLFSKIEIAEVCGSSN